MGTYLVIGILVGQFLLFAGEQNLLQGSARHSEKVAITTLHPSDSRMVDIPAFGSFGVARSDKEGNLYFAVDAGSDARHATILKIPPRKQDPIFFQFPPDAGGFLAYAVSPTGEVRLLVEDEKANLAMLDFDSRGKFGHKVDLQVPKSLRISDFLVFDDGNTFVAGYFGEETDKETRGKTYTALLDSSGRVYRMLSFEVPIDLQDLTTHGFDGASCLGFDNNIYVARGEEIRVFSESGKLLRKIPFQKPSSDFYVVNVARSVHYIAIWLSRATADGPNELNLLVLDPSTKQPIAIYVPDAELGTSAVSFSDDGFTFKNTYQNRVRFQFAERK